MSDVPTTYFTVSGDNHASVEAAVRVMSYYGLVGMMEARDLAVPLSSGPAYSRAVRDNVDRVLWALLQQGSKESAEYWVTQVRAAYKHWKENR